MNLLLNLTRKFLFLLPRVILVSIFMFALLMTVLSNFDVFEPYLPPLNLVRGTVREVNERVIAGPYPHLLELAGLKRKGVTVIISLLDTSLPQEKALLEREIMNAKAVGLEVRSFPMGYIPVNSEKNKETRKAILESLHNDRRKVYVHCYLGRHRATFIAEAVARGEKSY